MFVGIGLYPPRVAGWVWELLNGVLGNDIRPLSYILNFSAIVSAELLFEAVLGTRLKISILILKLAPT